MKMCFSFPSTSSSTLPVKYCLPSLTPCGVGDVGCFWDGLGVLWNAPPQLCEALPVDMELCSKQLLNANLTQEVHVIGAGIS